MPGLITGHFYNITMTDPEESKLIARILYLHAKGSPVSDISMQYGVSNSQCWNYIVENTICIQESDTTKTIVLQSAA